MVGRTPNQIDLRILKGLLGEMDESIFIVECKSQIQILPNPKKIPEPNSQGILSIGVGLVFSIGNSLSSFGEMRAQAERLY
jgi:hypothetical protein